MRRIKQLLPEAETNRILLEGKNGVLSLIDPEGEPYGVPISFAYDDGGNRIYFHSAVAGRKIDCVGRGARCSLCVVDQDEIVAEEFTTYFRSAIVTGHICIVSDKEEILRGLMLLCDKYSAGIDPAKEISRCMGHVAVMRLDIDSMTGKEAIELVRKRKGNGE